MPSAPTYCSGRGLAEDGYRDFPGRGTLINVFRAVHIAGLAGVSAAVLGGGSGHDGLFFALLAGSGFSIAAIDGWSSPAHFRQVNGLAVILKLVLVGLMLAWDAARLPLFWVILVYSVLISHAPGRIRHRRVF